MSIFAATIFWCFNALNKNYSTNISYPIEFQYDETKYVAVEPLPELVRVNVNGLGWDLFRKRVRLSIPPLVIPLEKPAEVKRIVGSTLPALFSSQGEGGMKINFVLTDTLFVDIDKRVSRRVNIKVDSLRNYLDDRYGIVGTVTISPSSVTIEGAERIVNSLPEEISLELPRNISESFDEEVDVLADYRDQLSIDPEMVEVSFNVDEMLEVQEMIRVIFLNPPAKLSAAALSSKVTIVYHLPSSLVEDLPGDSLYAELNLQKLGKGTHKLVPRVVGLPEAAVLARVDSVQVSF